ncbi:hypothetical protein TNCT_729751 [Trichonephila clavata]|uniref:Uncharacterized protein n=1 Tax=Trichonephila clavata TaxID=2740835 RepID=A0A8X6J9F3_TRICU|nr:hypothetical protein TNCT_729751 [Trichonephila clavata]
MMTSNQRIVYFGAATYELFEVRILKFVWIILEFQWMCWGQVETWLNKPRRAKQRLLPCLQSRLIYLEFPRKLKVLSEFGMGDTVTKEFLEIHLAIDQRTVRSSFGASGFVYHRLNIIWSKFLFFGVIFIFWSTNSLIKRLDSVLYLFAAGGERIISGTWESVSESNIELHILFHLE